MYKLLSIINLLEETTETGGNTAAAKSTDLPNWLTTLTNAITKVINPILIVAALVGVVYAIWVGITFIRAEDKNAREEAKQKLIYVIIGIVVVAVLIALFYWLYFALSNGWIDYTNWFGLAD